MQGAGGAAGQGRGARSEQWKQLEEDRRRSEDLSSLMAKMEVREGEVAGLRVEHAGREEEIKQLRVFNKAVVERVMLR